ncbi:Holliday junction resolvase [mine drainage metagenome]|uniref:Holliday junction resolvase n=1 Tax=mine drainage metagenome TaxID=410659 RepID=T1AFI2_9ZZZZ
MSLILGLDPGSRHTGYGLIESNGIETRLLDCGVIDPAVSDPLPNRLALIHCRVVHLAQTWMPAEVVVEKVFVHRNVHSALVLGQARGAALAAVMDQPSPPALTEYSPREIKQAVTAYGGAQKGQIQKMVALLLGLTELPQADAADALAVALCHAHQLRWRRLSRLAGGI